MVTRKKNARRRGLSWRFIALFLLITCSVLSFERWSGAYWLAEAMYFEARDESLKGRFAVANVIVNRIGDRASPEWRKATTIREIVDGGRDRGSSCEFSYRCDGKPDNPWLHHRSKWDDWLMIRAEAWLIYGLYATSILPDLTDGALFYKRSDAKSPYFDQMLQSGRFEEVEGDFGAHVFYRLKPAVTLRGSPESVGRAYRYAKRAGYDFAQTGEEIARLAAGRWWSDPTVASIDGMKNVRLSGVSYPYLLPEAATYLRRLAAEYAAACGDEPLVVTSAMRPLNEGRRNSLPRSVHPTGMAMDLSTTSNRCGKWLEEALLRGERAGFVDVTKEQRPPHYHVVVFPGQYTKWLAKTP